MLKCGAVFLHIPKTGGSWVTRVLTDCGLIEREFGHIHADMVRVLYYSSGRQVFWRAAYEAAKSRVPRAIKFRIMKPVRQRRKTQQQTSKVPFCFCFVRHPVCWYESWWRYMNARAGTDWAAESDLLGWHPCAAIKHLGADSFEQFVRNVIQHRPGFATELFAQYAQPRISFIGKQENLADDLIDVLQQLNITFDEQRIREHAAINVSSREASARLSDDLRAELERLEYAGMARYRYSMTSTVASTTTDHESGTRVVND